MLAKGKDCSQSVLSSFLDLLILFHSYSEAKGSGKEALLLMATLFRASSLFIREVFTDSIFNNIK